MQAKAPDEGKQEAAFKTGEGDNWYERNKEKLAREQTHHDLEIIKRILAGHKDSIRNILEIGCGNGIKVEELCNFFGAEGAGLDPSQAAVRDGNKRLSENGKNVHLTVGTASTLPFDNQSFDLVYFGFCLYLADRSQMFKLVSEADRVLRNGKFLTIFDFDPGLRMKRPYHHRPELYAFKNSYADFFTSGGQYFLVAKESFSHNSLHFDPDRDERLSVSILFKERDAY